MLKSRGGRSSPSLLNKSWKLPINETDHEKAFICLCKEDSLEFQDLDVATPVSKLPSTTIGIFRKQEIA
jgi:hypothetical protein